MRLIKRSHTFTLHKGYKKKINNHSWDRRANTRHETLVKKRREEKWTDKKKAPFYVIPLKSVKMSPAYEEWSEI